MDNQINPNCNKVPLKITGDLKYIQSQIDGKEMKNQCSTTDLCLDSIITVAQMLQVRGCVGLHGGEVVLQHVDHLRQLRVTPRKLPGITGEAQKHRCENRGRKNNNQKWQQKTNL